MKLKALHLAILAIFLTSSSLYAGEYRVTPIRVDFDAKNNKDVITIINEGTEKLRLRMKAVAWKQDETGKDEYVETSDLVFFPKTMEIDKDEKRVLRVGIKSPAIDKEMTYRLYIEEIPESAKSSDPSDKAPKVTISVRFGVPIFSKPSKENAVGKIESLALNKSSINILVKNTGNVNFMISSITVKGADEKGEEKFSKEVSGWYLLTGISRKHDIEVPPNICAEVKKFVVEIKTSRFTLSGTVDADKDKCLPY